MTQLDLCWLRSVSCLGHWKGEWIIGSFGATFTRFSPYRLWWTSERTYWPDLQMATLVCTRVVARGHLRSCNWLASIEPGYRSSGRYWPLSAHGKLRI